MTTGRRTQRWGPSGSAGLRSGEVRPVPVAPGLSPTPILPAAPGQVARGHHLSGTEQHAGNCSAFTPAEVARHKLSSRGSQARAAPRRAAPYLGCGWQCPRTPAAAGSDRLQQPPPTQTEPAREHPPAGPELLALPTHLHPAARAQPAPPTGAATGGCVPALTSLATHPGARLGIFPPTKKETIFILFY